MFTEEGVEEESHDSRCTAGSVEERDTVGSATMGGGEGIIKFFKKIIGNDLM